MDNKLFKRVANLALDKQYEWSKYDSAVLKLYQDYLQCKNTNRNFDVAGVKKNFITTTFLFPLKERLKILASKDSHCIWGMKPNRETSEKILNAINNDEEIIFAEDAFLRCIVTPAHLLSEEQKYLQASCGYILDDLTAYFDGTRPSRMELILNSDFKVTEEQKERSRKVMKKIINNKISKYNNQPIFTPQIGREGVKKVLVIDQSYKDFSILKGLADDDTFNNMLETAIKENPDADILVKTHPDAMGEKTTKQKCYYQNLQPSGNVYRLTEPINPISLIEYVDKVYVCSSQFGFEALMCNKEVHVFGMPFYANWGLTIDAQKCDRRKRLRTLEEVFYVAYIYMAQYINPDKDEVCEIEDAVDYLIDKRNEYFKEVLNV